MNRTDRLYALVEELRAVAPRPRTSRWLADRFEVSVRTVERDLSALQQAGVPIWATRGPNGGYAIDPARTLAPVNFTADEALALALALVRAGPIPYAASGRTALHKIVAAMSGSEADQARHYAERMLVLADDEVPSGVPRELEQSVLSREVIEINYVDSQGDVTVRAVEPVGFVGGDYAWYLVAWCRLREAGRSFRVDRIRTIRFTGETAPDRPFNLVPAGLESSARKLPLAE